MNHEEKRRLAEALAERYTSGFGDRNPDWDIDRSDGPDNSYYFDRPMDERVMDPPSVVSVASDGYNSLSFPTITELVEELDEAIETMIRCRETKDKEKK